MAFFYPLFPTETFARIFSGSNKIVINIGQLIHFDKARVNL